MNPQAYVPSTRTKIYNLVRAAASRQGVSPVRIWNDLYSRFEHETNTPWRKLAHNNGMTPLDAIHAKRKLEALLNLARDTLGPARGAVLANHDHRTLEAAE